MHYNEFKEYIMDNIAGVYADVMMSEQVSLKGSVDNDEIERIKSCEVAINQITKNNGIKLDALSIYKKGEKLSPNIYLKPYYDRYLMGKPLDFIMTEMVFHYRNERADTDDLQCKRLNDYDEIKDRIIVRLINKELNKELLKGCPYIEYLDLAITFRYLVSNGKKGLATIMITNKEFDEWNVSKEDLYAKALDNTMMLFPCKGVSLFDVVLEGISKHDNLVSEEVLKEINNLQSGMPRMHLFTNLDKAFGAAVILYDGVIRNFADAEHCNVFILPSSVHEVMLVPDDGTFDADFLKGLLENANDSSVGVIDLLGDDIYYYDLETDSISICETD
ncbi:MAG: hypothetical protein IJ661_00225 [Lachnospiraceae bacterium]|nr:hypothetical protein [Lachnospiraceae bacterium]